MGAVARGRLIGTRVGIQLGATTPPAELGPIATEAERLGYGEIWLAEDYFRSGGISSVASVLAATRDVAVGLGVAAAVARHPAVMAMELATLGGAFPARFMAGLGHGVPGWVRQMGLQPASVLLSLREASVGIRRLLDGEEVTEEGEYFSFEGVRLLHPPAERVPLYFGVHGPRSLELSGELADGTLLGWFTTPDSVAWARERIDEGRIRAGRMNDHALVALCITSISESDPATARQELAAWAGPRLADMADSPEMRATEPGGRLRSQVAVGGAEAAGRMLPDGLLDEFAAAGDVTDCSRAIGRLLDAGADRVVLVPNPAGMRSTASMLEQIRAAASLATA